MMPHASCHCNRCRKIRNLRFGINNNKKVGTRSDLMQNTGYKVIFIFLQRVGRSLVHRGLWHYVMICEYLQGTKNFQFQTNFWFLSKPVRRTSIWHWLNRETQVRSVTMTRTHLLDLFYSIYSWLADLRCEDCDRDLREENFRSDKLSQLQIGFLFLATWNSSIVSSIFMRLALLLIGLIIYSVGTQVIDIKWSRGIIDHL